MAVRTRRRQLLFPPLRDERGNDGDGEDAANNGQRHGRVDVDARRRNAEEGDFRSGENHLHADEGEHDRQADIEESQVAHHAGQQEVERPQAENGEDVRGVDDEHVLRDGQHRRNRVDGEHQVGRLDDEQHEEELRHHALAVFDVEKMRRIAVADGQVLEREFINELLLGLDLVVAAFEQLDARKDEKRAKNVKEPFEVQKQLDAQEDEERPHDERAHDSPEEHAPLLVNVDLEERKDDDEDKEIVHRERFFEQVGREILAHMLGADNRPDREAKDDGQTDPDRRPDGRALERIVVRLVVGKEVNDQAGDDDSAKDDPEPKGLRVVLCGDRRAPGCCDHC